MDVPAYKRDLSGPPTESTLISGKMMRTQGEKLAKSFQGETTVIAENLGWNFVKDPEIGTYLA